MFILFYTLCDRSIKFSVFNFNFNFYFLALNYATSS